MVSIFLLSILFVTKLLNWSRFGEDYDGIHPLVFASIPSFLVLLFIISKRGRPVLAAYMLTSLFAIGAMLSGWLYGESLPATLLTNTLVIVTASILLGSGIGFFTAVIMVLASIALGWREAFVMGVPDWHMRIISATDLASYVSIFFFLSFISWLSNREIDKSLYRARHSEKLLEQERNSLERIVAERTEDMLASERKRFSDLEENARFGELSQGLFHDLMNPLSSLALYVEHMAKAPNHPEETAEMVEKTLAASRRMKSFMTSIRRASDCTGCVGENTTNLAKEVQIVKDLTAYKARVAGIKITVGKCDQVSIPVEPIRIHQMFLNLVSNAIEAYPKSIIISLEKTGDRAVFQVTDNGCGIPAELSDKLGRRPFTTKPNGTGRGLMTTRAVVEELGGEFKIESKHSIGTVCVVTIPIKKNGQNHTKTERSRDKSP